MAREALSDRCSAQVLMGDDDAAAILPCRARGEGYCLKDRRREAAFPNVCVLKGVCLADEKDGVTDPVTPASLLGDNIHDVQLNSFIQTTLYKAAYPRR